MPFERPSRRYQEARRFESVGKQRIGTRRHLCQLHSFVLCHVSYVVNSICRHLCVFIDPHHHTILPIPIPCLHAIFLLPCRWRNKFCLPLQRRHQPPSPCTSRAPRSYMDPAPQVMTLLRMFQRHVLPDECPFSVSATTTTLTFSEPPASVTAALTRIDFVTPSLVSVACALQYTKHLKRNRLHQVESGYTLL